MADEKAPAAPRVHGLGGVFFKAEDPAALSAWYARHLGLDMQSWGGAILPWKRADTGGEACTVFAPFKASTEHFKPSEKSWMFNFRVDDLAATLASLREEGCTVLDERYQESAEGKFGYVLDAEGGLVELWEPAPESSGS